MLTPDAFDALRATEFSRLDDQNLAYLDYVASALYGASQAAAYADRLTGGVLGNPHSEHAASRASERDLAQARALTLAFFDADPAVYDVIFTANTSAAIKLVAESYPFGPGRGLALSADNHNSVNGVREYARVAGAPIAVLPLNDDLALDDPAARLAQIAANQGPGLFAFPAQSNFSGACHPLELIGTARRLGFDVLIDAAGAGLSGTVSLAEHPADFLAFSFYKLFGLPTGMGALVARHDALARLRRPWFAGGTVKFVSVEHDRHRLQPGHEGFEDGTPNFLGFGAIIDGFAFLGRIDRPKLRARLSTLTQGFIDRAQALTHADGSPLVKVYGASSAAVRCGAVAFNILRPDGTAVPYAQVERQARVEGVAIRGGCFCNPGASERAFGHHRFDVAACLDDIEDEFTVGRFHHRLGPQAVVGALRLSVGLPSNAADIDRALNLAAGFAA